MVPQTEMKLPILIKKVQCRQIDKQLKDRTGFVLGGSPLPMAMYWALKAKECDDANVLERLKDVAKMNGCAHCGKKTVT